MSRNRGRLAPRVPAWRLGYEVYPFDRQIEALAGKYRILIPDRTGYGRSPRITLLPPEFHRLAAVETSQVLDALRIEQAVLWGHSDGAVIAALLGLAAPHHIIVRYFWVW